MNLIVCSLGLLLFFSIELIEDFLIPILFPNSSCVKDNSFLN